MKRDAAGTDRVIRLLIDPFFIGPRLRAICGKGGIIITGVVADE
jgi:hypothetical protein